MSRRQYFPAPKVNVNSCKPNHRDIQAQRALSGMGREIGWFGDVDCSQVESGRSRHRKHPSLPSVAIAQSES